ncbi:MAG: DNA-binding protein [Desulfuromonadales bacterium]|nr:DNA-binding protein [Desulfuromonadales bacterium]
MTHYTAKELADLSLPGLPASERGIQIKAKREDWEGRKREGTKATEYPLSALPKETRLALAAGTPAPVISDCETGGQQSGRKLANVANLDQARTRRATETRLKKNICFNPKEQRREEARRLILADWENYHQVSGEPINASMQAYSALYNLHQRTGMGEAYALVKKISARTLHHWRRQIKERGSLMANYGTNKGRNKIDSQPQIRDFVLAMLTAYPHASAVQVSRALEARYGADSTVSLPSQGRVSVWLDNWKKANRQLFAAITNPDAWKDNYLTAFGSASEGITALNQLWEFDGTPADVMFIDGRHVLTGAIDVYSRRPKILVSPTAKATAVVSLLRSCLLDWGLPSHPVQLTAKTDNGSDYTAHHITRAMESLDINHALCPPFSPWNKPHIERFFRTFSHDLVELLPGYIGHNVVDRKAIEARKAFSERLFKKDQVIELNMTAADFQTFADEWIRVVLII